MVTRATPLDTLPLPAGATFEIAYLRFSGSHGWIPRTLHGPGMAKAHLSWTMATANVERIRVTIRPERGPAHVFATFTLNRRTPLDEWHCPQIPDWRTVIDERSAVAEAERIVAQHARRGWTR